MILFVDLKESIWATFWVVMISVFMFLILVSIFYILLHLVSKRIGLRQSAVQMVKRASWSAFPLAAVGVISGYMTGASREPAVDALIPAVLTFLGGAAIYFSRGHPVRSYVMGFVVFVFSVNLLLGITLGSHGRARAEAFEKSPENQMRQAVNELQIRMYRKSLGLPLDPAKPPAVVKSKQ